MRKHTHAIVVGAGQVISWFMVAGASAQTDRFYVDVTRPPGGNGASWTTAFNDLQNALTHSNLSPGDEIWVADGTYSPGISSSSTFLVKSGIKLFGGFAGNEASVSARSGGETILSGQVGGTQRAIHVVTADATVTTEALLDRITIRDGRGLANSDPTQRRGAGLYIDRALVKLVDCMFFNNIHPHTSSDSFYDSYGAGLFAKLDQGQSLRLTGCVFGREVSQGLYESNRAMYGGAVAIDKINGNGEEDIVSFVSCDFVGNEGVDANPVGCGVSSKGGAIWLEGSPNSGEEIVVELVGCEFRDNTTESSGGAVHAFGTLLAATNCIYLRNSCLQECGTQWGGALNVDGPGQIDLDGCDFWENSASNGGAVVAADRVPFNIFDCYFFGNKAQYNGSVDGAGAGGALRMNEAGTVVGCVFESNLAVAHGQGFFAKGGAIYTNTADPISIEWCDFKKNCADWGGAVYLHSGGTPDSTITGTSFVNNSGNLGGAMYLRGDTIVTSCVIAKNGKQETCYDNGSEIHVFGPASHGGGMYQESAGATSAVINCTIAENNASIGAGRGGGVYVKTGVFTLVNGIVWGNTGISGTQLDQDMPNLISISYSDVQGGWTGSGNINADPQFVSGGDFAIVSTSPCVDAGLDSAVPLDYRDCDADNNISEQVGWDVAFNPRFVDSNAQSSEDVDMGGYEYQEICLADWDGDGDVDSHDLIAYLADFGPCIATIGYCDPATDLNGDGSTNTLDFILFLNRWVEGCT